MPGLVAELFVPEFEFEVLNKEEVLKAMAEKQLQATRERMKRGQGVKGSLPRGKKPEGRPLVDTGQLEASIGVEYKLLGKGTYAAIVPTGDRSDLKTRMQARRDRHKRKKDEVRAAFGQQEVDIGAVNPFIAAAVFDRALKAKLKKVKLGPRVRARNMDVAAILAHAPKDKRAKAGNRGVYDFWWYADGELDEVREEARRVMRVAFVEKGSGARHEGRPE